MVKGNLVVVDLGVVVSGNLVVVTMSGKGVVTVLLPQIHLKLLEQGCSYTLACQIVSWQLCNFKVQQLEFNR